MKAYSFPEGFILNPCNISKQAALNESLQCEPHSAGGSGVEDGQSFSFFICFRPAPGDPPSPFSHICVFIVHASVCLWNGLCLCSVQSISFSSRSVFWTRSQEIISSFASLLISTPHTPPCQEGENSSFLLLKLWSLQPRRISLLTT